MKEDNVRELTCGFMFQNNFKMLDSWGSIADGILKDPLFDGFFANVSNKYTTELSLYNENNNNSFLLKYNKIVLTQTIYDDFESEYNMFRERVVNYIIPKLLCEYRLITRRIGIVYDTKLESQEIENFSKKYFNPEFRNISNFRFAINNQKPEAKILKKEKNYINRLFTVGDFGNGDEGISYDYQLRFNPLQPELRNLIVPFLNNANNSFKKDILDIIGEQYEHKKE